MPREHDYAGGTLYNGDCLEYMEQLADGSVDMVLTDPPYGVAYKSGRRQEKEHRFNREILNDRDLSALEAIAPHLWRVLPDDAACFVFCAWKKLNDVDELLRAQGFDIRNHIIWDKGVHTVGDLKHDFGYQYEPLVFATKGRPEIRGHRWSDVWKCMRVPADKQLHQNQKPTSILSRAILAMSDEGATVLDPFMGSGSTGVACLDTNRRFIGCELDEGYFAVALKRLDAESAQGRLFF